MQGSPGGIMNFIPLIFIFGVFYFMIIRPQQKKQKEHASMLQSLKKNDDVITSSGMHGTIVNVKDKTFVVRFDDNVKIEMDKAAVACLKKS
jgi:preprotein translocase subunit YajC